MSLVTSRLENVKHREHWEQIESLPPAASSLKSKPVERRLLEQTVENRR